MIPTILNCYSDHLAAWQTPFVFTHSFKKRNEKTTNIIYDLGVCLLSAFHIYQLSFFACVIFNGIIIRINLSCTVEFWEAMSIYRTINGFCHFMNRFEIIQFRNLNHLIILTIKCTFQRYIFSGEFMIVNLNKLWVFDLFGLWMSVFLFSVRPLLPFKLLFLFLFHSGREPFLWRHYFFPLF